MLVSVNREVHDERTGHVPPEMIRSNDNASGTPDGLVELLEMDSLIESAFSDPFREFFEEDEEG